MFKLIEFMFWLMFGLIFAMLWLFLKMFGIG
jgi:hypothetical protein